MATATRLLNFRLPHSSPFLPNPSPSHLPPLFSTLPSKSFTLTLDSSNFCYGPSLLKGSKPEPSLSSLPSCSSEEDEPIDRDSFSRTYRIAALRVPAEHCFLLENRLRGHLLNWPRVRNVARVLGDDFDADFDARLLPKMAATGDEEEMLKSVERRIYGNAAGDGEKLSPVLYREKLAKTFNCRGFVKFRNLAKISRPKTKKKRKKEEGKEGVKRVEKNDFVSVEVINSGDDDEDLSGLLGSDFKSGTWQGPTRLLLLDERYADSGEEELPESVKVASL